MSIARIGRHLVANRARVRKAFPAASLKRIGAAITASETHHAGQIRFVVEGALDGAPLFRQQTARARALDVFAQLRVWDTEHNNGVLIYLLLADRDVEIIADRGIDRRVGKAGWETICTTMERAFGRGDYEAGILAGIDAVTKHLAAHFPRGGAQRNELPDAPVVM
jgi:uncharacterized membrane protein